MIDDSYRLVLDTSAVLAYGQTEHVGELLTELADEGVKAAVPVVCMVQAAQQVNRDLLRLLADHAAVNVVPVPQLWESLVEATAIIGRIDAAAAAMRVEPDGYLLTAEPELYGGFGETFIIEIPKG